jgi:hypothetical protein
MPDDRSEDSEEFTHYRQRALAPDLQAFRKSQLPAVAASTKRFIRSPTNRERIIVFDARAWAVTDLAADGSLGCASLTLRTHFELY